MRLNFILGIMLILISKTGDAQVMGNWRYNGQAVRPAQIQQIVNSVVSNDHEFNFQAKTLMNASTLAYVATFNISQVGNDLKDVVTKSENRIRGFIEDLKNIGIDTNDITVDMISMIPVYDYEVQKKFFSKSYNEIPVGFELQKNIIIKYDKNSYLDHIVRSAVNNEIYDLVKVDYFVDDIETIKDTLRKITLDYYQRKMSDLKTLGIGFDTLYQVFSEDYQTIMPHTRYNNYTAFSRPSLKAAQGKGIPVDDPLLKRSPKTQTLYYNPVSYTDFDIVINPVIQEPAVQFTYSINIKFIVKKEDNKKPDRQYFYMTPNGNIQQLHF